MKNRSYNCNRTRRKAMETNIQNMKYLGKIMSICNNQHLSNI